MNVGFVGLGNQGLPMAQMIERAGWPLFVWARHPASVEPFAGTSTTVVASPAELAEQCDVVGVCVRSDDDVREVVLGTSGLRDGLHHASVLLIHSTVLPETCIDIAAALAASGAGVLDAPVSGSGPAALAQTLTVMVGGDRTLFDRVEPIFESYGAGIWLGPLGSGQRMKLLNNAVFMANLLSVIEAFDVADELGLDAGAVEHVLERSSGGSRAIATLGRFRTLSDLERPRTTLAKDLHHFDDLVSNRTAGRHFSDLGPRLLERLARLDADIQRSSR